MANLILTAERMALYGVSTITVQHADIVADGDYYLAWAPLTAGVPAVAVASADTPATIEVGGATFAVDFGSAEAVALFASPTSDAIRGRWYLWDVTADPPTELGTADGTLWWSAQPDGYVPTPAARAATQAWVTAAIATHNLATAAHPFTAADKMRYGGTAGAVTEGDITALSRTALARATAALWRTDIGAEASNANIQTHVTGTGSPHTAAGVGAYRAQTVAAPANAGGAVTLAFGTDLILPLTLTSNWTSTVEPTGLADGNTGAAFVTLSGYTIHAAPTDTATAVYGPWTVTGPIVRVGVQRVGTVYYWTAISF